MCGDQKKPPPPPRVERNFSRERERCILGTFFTLRWEDRRERYVIFLWEEGGEGEYSINRIDVCWPLQKWSERSGLAMRYE